MHKTTRHTVLGTTFFLAAGLAMGCASTERRPAAEPSQAGGAAAEVDKGKTEADQAARDAQEAQDYAYAKKADLIDKMTKELADIQAELDRLSAKVEKSTGEAKAEAKLKLEAAREQWAKAKKQLEAAQGATESTWDDVKSGVKKSYGELQDSVAKARQWVSDKIEP